MRETSTVRREHAAQTVERVARAHGRAHRAFERGRVGALDIVAGGDAGRRRPPSPGARSRGVQAKVARFSAIVRSAAASARQTIAREAPRLPVPAPLALVASSPRSTQAARR